MPRHCLNSLERKWTDILTTLFWCGKIISPFTKKHTVFRIRFIIQSVETMMSNIQVTLRRIFGILFIFSITFTAFAQQEQQPAAALSQSQFMQIIDRIDKSEERMRKHVDEKFGELDKKIDKLDEKFEAKFGELDNKFNQLSADVAFINGQLTIIKWSITIFGAPLFVGLIIYYLQNRKKTGSTIADVATKAAESKEESDEGIMRRKAKP